MSSIGLGVFLPGSDILFLSGWLPLLAIVSKLWQEQPCVESDPWSMAWMDYGADAPQRKVRVACIMPLDARVISSSLLRFAKQCNCRLQLPLSVVLHFFPRMSPFLSNVFPSRLSPGCEVDRGSNWVASEFNTALVRVVLDNRHADRWPHLSFFWGHQWTSASCMGERLMMFCCSYFGFGVDLLVIHPLGSVQVHVHLKCKVGRHMEPRPSITSVGSWFSNSPEL